MTLPASSLLRTAEDVAHEARGPPRRIPRGEFLLLARVVAKIEGAPSSRA